MHRLLTFSLLFFASAPVAQVDDATSAILWALRLPALVTEARQAGVTEVAVGEVLDRLRERGLAADEVAMVVREEVDAIDAGGPKDNFGAFVQQQLAAGLRGRALAQAIRGEHRALGVGRPGGRKAQPPGRDTTRRGGGRP